MTISRHPVKLRRRFLARGKISSAGVSERWGLARRASHTPGFTQRWGFFCAELGQQEYYIVTPIMWIFSPFTFQARSLLCPIAHFIPLFIAGSDFLLGLTSIPSPSGTRDISVTQCPAHHPLQGRAGWHLACNQPNIFISIWWPTSETKMHGVVTSQGYLF